MSALTIAGAVETALGWVGKFFNTLKDYGSYYKDTSLPSATKLTRVEPITIVSKDLLNHPENRTILNTLLSMFCGYYLQAIDILTKVNDVEVVKILDSLNPDRDETGFLLQDRVEHGRRFGIESRRSAFENVNSESYAFRLPTHSMPALAMEGSTKLAIESLRVAGEATEQVDTDWLDSVLLTSKTNAEALDALAKNRKDLEDQVKDLRRQNTSKTAELELKAVEAKLNQTKFVEELAMKNKDFEYKKWRDSREYVEKGTAQNVGKDVDLDTLVNLSLGRLLNVQIAYSKTKDPHNAIDNRFVTIPVAVRLLVSAIPNESITRIMTYKSQDTSLIERIHDVRSGRIEFIRDLIFCQDLIDEYKKATIQDPTNVLAEITKRNVNAKKFGLLTKNPSLVAASTLFVISDKVARDIESKLGGKLDNSRIREKAFENTYAMIMVVVSTDWENATFYIRGIARGASFSFRELQGKTKGNGPDVTDIMKALMAGQPPSF